jgi:hypothetical protein
VYALSIAGLITARVLSDHFEEVTVIEPDPVLEGKRTRVPQWNQMHSTDLVSGQPIKPLKSISVPGDLEAGYLSTIPARGRGGREEWHRRESRDVVVEDGAQDNRASRRTPPGRLLCVAHEVRPGPHDSTARYA